MKYRHVSAFLLLILGTSFAKADPPGGDWPQWMGPNRNNHSVESGLLKTWPAGGPPLAWKAEGLGHGVASIAVSRGVVYTLGYREEKEFVTAIDEVSGKIRWATSIGPDIKENSIMRYLAQRTPTIDGEQLYAVTARGEVVCLATVDGKKRWSRDFAKETGWQRGIWGFCDYPLVDGNRLICTPGGSTGTFLALDKTNGEIIWKTSVPDAGTNGYSCIIEAEYGGVKQYVNFLGKGLIGIAATDGRFLWRYNSHSSSTGNTHNLVPLKETLFSANGFNTGSVLLRLQLEGTTFRVEELYRGKERFQSWFGTAIRLGDHVVTLSDPGALQCHVLATGKLAWTHPPRTSRNRAIITLADGHLYIRYMDGKVALHEVTADGVQLKSEFQGPKAGNDPAWTMPVVTGGRLYLRDQDRLYSYDVKDRGGKAKEPDAVFVSTPQDIVLKMLELAKVQKGDRVFDLGCGDGRIMVTAAQLYGASATGYEIDPECIRLTLENIKKHQVEHLVSVKQKDLFTADLSKADVVALYLLPEMLEKLQPQLAKLKPGARIVAHHFPIPGIKPDQVVQVESNEDFEKHAIYLWTAPLKKAVK